LRNISDAENSLNDIKDGPKQSEITSKQLTLKQKQDAYNDHFIRAPFDGVIGKMSVNVGDDISSGSSLVTVISKNNYVSITLNEVDISRVKIGQKATITLDAIDNKTFDGEVSEVDLVGTVSQGVVSYGIKVSVDSSDSDIKPGMSATANIVYGGKTSVLVLHNNAVKSQGKSKYVEIVKDNISDQTAFRTGTVLNNPPVKQVVETGESNDSITEIISGLNDGDIVVSQTISSNSKTTTQSAGLFNFGRQTGTQQRSSTGASTVR
jgi:HlyD family secretion protein